MGFRSFGLYGSKYLWNLLIWMFEDSKVCDFFRFLIVPFQVHLMQGRYSIFSLYQYFACRSNQKQCSKTETSSIVWDKKCLLLQFTTQINSNIILVSKIAQLHLLWGRIKFIMCEWFKFDSPLYSRNKIRWWDIQSCLLEIPL